MASDNERGHFRAEMRKPLEMPVRFRTGEALEQRGRTLDLGVHGAFVQCPRPPAAGTKLTLELRSPTAWDPLKITCQVRWVSNGVDEPPGFGVRFEDLSATQATALHDFLQTLDYDEAAQ